MQSIESIKYKRGYKVYEYIVLSTYLYIDQFADKAKCVQH